MTRKQFQHVHFDESRWRERMNTLSRIDNSRAAINDVQADEIAWFVANGLIYGPPYQLTRTGDAAIGKPPTDWKY